MIIDIKRIGINGEGIGYFKKIPVFVAGSLVGESVEVNITENNKNYKVGKLLQVINKSEDRINPICNNYKRCGGCSLMHTTYENQLEIKKSLLSEALNKYAGLDLDIEIEESDKQLNYRNCLKLPFIYSFGKLSLGIYEEETNFVCPIKSCLVHSELLERLKDEVLDVLNKANLQAYDHKTKKGLRTLVLREIGNRAHMCLVTGDDKLPKRVVDELSGIKEIVSIYQCINVIKSNNIFSNKMIHLSGGKHLSFKIDDLKFNLSIRSFYQLNSNQAKRMYRYVSSLIKDNQDLIVEAYSGIGVMSLLNKDKAKNIVGIEYVEDAVVNGNVNANINHIDNVKFICGDAGEVLNKEFKNKTIDTLIVDPPRSGLDERMIDAIVSNRIKTIIYVSCNPATLAKNINDLSRRYRLESIKAFDMFPQTPHCESVSLLIRK